MKLKYRPFAAIGFTVLLSLFLFFFISKFFVVFFAGAGLLLLLISVLFRKVRERIVPIYVASALLFSGLVYYAANAEPTRVSEYIGKTTQINGYITDNPEFDNSRYYYSVKINSIDGKAVNTKLRLSLPEKISADVFDEISLNAKVYEISSESRDVQLYYYSKGIFLGAYSLDSDEMNVRVTKNSRHSFEKLVFNVRELIVDNISDNVQGENGATITAILLGDKSGLSDARIESFREAGVAPIFAVSGLHLSIWILGLYSLLESFGLNKRINSLISIILTLFFMFLTGLSPSVCRAGIMMVLFLMGNLFHRKTDSVNSLGFVALLLCTINPYIAVDTGFLLSFSATLGIVTLVPAFDKNVLIKLPENSFGKFLRKVLLTVAVGVSATLAVLPFTILLIGKVSVWSVISNLLLSYVAAACMIAGGIGAITANIPYVSDALFAVAKMLSDILLKTVDLICSLSFTLISTENLFWKIGAIASVAIVIISAANFNGKNIFRFACVGLAVNIVVFSISAYFYYDGLVQLRILNLDYGISVVAYSAGDKVVITGEADVYDKIHKTEETLDFYNQKRPDLLLIADKNALSDSSNYTIIKNNNFKRVVLPDSDTSLESIRVDEKIYVESKATIDIFDGDNIRYVCCESYSLALFIINNIKILILFDSYKNADIPEEYLDADYLICDDFIPYSITPESYSEVIVCGDTKTAVSVADYVTTRGGSAQLLCNFDSALFNIRNDSHKIILLEG